MRESQILTGARIVLPDEVIEGTVVIEGGAVAEVAPGRVAAAGAIDLEGDYLMPGLIDLHTDNLEKHIMPRPGVRFDTMLAAMAHDAQMISSGITTVLDSICIGTSVRNPERREMLMPTVDGIRAARDRGLLRADHLLHMRCEITDAEVVGLFTPFATDPLIRLMSVMDHSPGQRQSPDIEKYKQKQLAYGMISREAIDRLTDELMEASRTIGPANRKALVALGRENGIPVASHDDDSIAHVDLAASEGVVICEFPTTLAAARQARARGLHVLMGSPNILRGGSHSGNVAAVELAHERLLGVVASDYIPISLLQGAFALAGGGIGYALPEAVATVTLNPATAIGLNDRGQVAAGKRADLIRVGMVGDHPAVRAVWSAGRQVF
jgi:alpha-D-ribose 1-methylphosphonate 5-triphosphate diphosphatase